MYNGYSTYGYRRLTMDEQALAEAAIKWLADKHLKAKDIALLTERNLDREGKSLYLKMESRHLIWFRKIRYNETPLDRYLTEVLPCLKVEKWLFPNRGWIGKKNYFGFHVHADAVENYLKNCRRKHLIMVTHNDNIEVSTTNTHIKTKIMVGRR